MDKAFTINPIYSEDDGSLQDFEVTTGNNFSRSIQHEIEQQFVEGPNGQMNYQQVEDPEQKMHMGGFDSQDYFATVAEATPGLTEMVEWAKTDEAIPPDLIEQWDNAINTGDLESFYDTLEILMGLWIDNGKPGERLSEEETVNQWFEELPQDYVDNEMQEISNTTYTIEQAEQMAEAARNYAPGSVEHGILAAGVDMAFGKEQFSEASKRLMFEHGAAKLAAGYMNLKHLLN